MPFTTICPTHPEADVSYPSEVWAHIRADHPGENPQAVFDALDSKFMDMAEALDHDRIFITYCGVCATRIEVVRVPGDDTPADTKCEAHR